MMRFSADKERTQEPEKLSIWQKAKVIVVGVNIPRPINRKTPADFGLSYETVNFMGAHGLQLEAWRVRHAEAKGTVILFHGYTASKDSLLPAAQEFSTLGYDTLLVDFYGSGGSAGNETSVGYYEGDDVAAAFRFARENQPGGPVILYGISMGAAAVLRAVHAHDIRPDALILECPFDRLLTTVQNRFAAMHLPSFPAAQLLVFWGGVQQGFNGFNYNPADYLRAASCPVLLMHGGEDSRVKLSEANNLARNLNERSSFKVFPGVPHQSYVVDQAEEWRASVGELLQKLGERNRASAAVSP